MPIADGASLNGLLSTPLVLPVAGGLAALAVVLAVMALRRAGAGSFHRLVPAVGLVFAVLAVFAVLDRLATDDKAAERRALLQRIAELDRGAVAPGTMLACLDGGAGEAIENACEKAVFADPQSAASAVAYIGARLTLLAEAVEFSKRGDNGPLEALSSARRAIELDRYGIVAHVLAVRDGCTVERCAAFALLRDAGTLKANFRVHAFDNYVERYASAWNKAPDEKPVAAAAPPPALASASEPPAGHPVSSKYDFPSAASIPAVSIMNSEPPPPKDPAAAAGSPIAAAPAGDTPAPAPAAKLPPKRPPAQAATPPAR